MKKKLVFGLIGFLLLDLYFNLAPVRLPNPYLQLGTMLLFFPLAHNIAKLVGLNGLAGIGVFFHKGWGKNFLISFLIGFSFWMIWYGIHFLLGDYTIKGVNHHFIGMPLLELIVGFLLGSLINDIIVRGYIISLLKNYLNIKWVFGISVAVYALEDFWMAGLSVSNIVFSAILGTSLTFAFFKTGSIWANTGIHFGLNFAYGLLFGLPGNSENAAIHIVSNESTHLFSSSLQFIVPSLMYIFVFWAIRFYKQADSIERPTFNASFFKN